MAFDRGLRTNNGRTSSICSATTIVVVSICLFGAWMITSMTITPLDMSLVSDKPKTKDIIPETNYTSSSEVLGDNGSSGGVSGSIENIVPPYKSDPHLDTGVTGSVVEKPQKDDLAKGNASNENKGTETNNQSDDIDKPQESEENESDKKLQPEEEKKPMKPDGYNKSQDDQVPRREKIDENNDEEELKSDAKKDGNQLKDQNEVLPPVIQSELLNETNTENGMWPTQDAESRNEKSVQDSSTPSVQIMDSGWKLCNATAGADYIPCLDNEAAIRKLHSTMHYEHRERHCPENPPTCLVPLPDRYKQPIQWPESRDKVRYNNVPHTSLAKVKGHQNWLKVSGEYVIFPGGGTQFIHGAPYYIDFIEKSLPEIGWGRKSRVILDVGCGVASFGGYLFDRNVITMSFAPKDEHEAQVQFALERGIPAVSAVMGTKRLPFPSKVFDVIHCARCRVPWHIEGGTLLLELNRLLRPGGYFVWSATPVYRKGPEDVGIWRGISHYKHAYTKYLRIQLDVVHIGQKNGHNGSIKHLIG